jgi:NMD protein affecting ribosome stability and mRNA decay
MTAGAAHVVVIKDNYLHYAVVGNIKIAVFRKGDLVPVSAGHTIDMLVENKFVEGTITKEEALKRLEDKRVYNYLGQDRKKWNCLMRLFF